MNRHPEHQYLDILRELRDKLVKHGATANRTAVKAVKVAGRTMRFDLSDGTIPMLTTKKLHLKSIVAELLWFLSGDTNNETLAKQGVRIWNEWAIPEDENRLSATEVHDYYVRAMAEAEDIKPSEAEARVKYAEERGLLDDLIEACALTPVKNRTIHAKGDLGPLYGQQWRRFPAGDFFKSKSMSLDELSTYIDAMALDQYAQLKREASSQDGRGIDLSIARDVLGEDIGIDQISQAITLLKTQPNSRRNIVTAWNPQVVPSDALSPQDNVRRGRAALAACHTFFQFITEELTLDERIELVNKARGYDQEASLVEALQAAEFARGFFGGMNIPTHRLNCTFFCRSQDTMLGTPYNVASYAILTRMVAQVVNMAPGELIWTGGDVHLYKNHLDAANEQLTREPYPFPQLLLNPDKTNLFDFQLADIKLINYHAHDSIKAEVAV